MTVDLSFKGVSKFIKKDFSGQVDDVDTFLNLLLFASALISGNPLVAGATAIHNLADIFASKGELSKVSKNIIKKIIDKNDNDPLTRLERMEYAYGLICYSAFFEALDHNPLLSQLLKEIRLKPEEKLQLSQATNKLLENPQNVSTGLNESEKVPSTTVLSDFIPALPHPIDGFDEQANQLLPLYRELTVGFLSFVECLAIWDTTDEIRKLSFKKGSETLPEESVKYFKAQYYLLAVKFEEFYIWSNLQEHEKTRANLKEMSTLIQKYAHLEKASKIAIDLGFQRMADTIKGISEQIEAGHVNSVLQELATFYASAIEKPVIDDQSGAEGGKLMLHYPKRSEIFIPQSFKVIRRTGRELLSLENEQIWAKLPRRNDLGAFLLSYFSSPYSTRSPLIILGHPGSGKSLLTSILAARLIASPYTPIRVELRGINAEDEIPKQIEDQIYKNTYRKIDWTILSDHFREQPGLILLDGFDELLQASGKVFSGYLRKVELFQQNELSIGHSPVRAIVTSRITLIDKAFIPIGTTIIRLLEFDQWQQKNWISVWNAANDHYFQQTQIEPFELPEKNKKIAVLAEQPLLLLMLALYDSEGNQLRKQTGLDQTILYNSLLRRFIQREHMKDEVFSTLPQQVQDEGIDQDMDRLGIAAIGMYNRRSLYIQKSQLDDDLKFFGLVPKFHDADARLLSQADLLLGGFFFVQESKSEYTSESSQIRDADIAFEFLHNTFGEFLTADFILRKVLAQSFKIYKFRHDEELNAELEEKLANADGFPKDWFACLMYAPLFSRPVILDMMREWLKYCLKQRKRNESDFLEGLDTIVLNQLKLLLFNNTFPSIMMEKGKVAFGTLPILGYAAIYSLNLILLRTMLSENGYIFDEETLPPSLDRTRAWDRLYHLWRSWFAVESLDGLTSILRAKREDSKIYLKALKTFSISSENNPLYLIFNVSSTLADNIGAGLSGLLVYNQDSLHINDLDVVNDYLENENIFVRAKIYVIKIRYLRWKQATFELTELLFEIATKPIDVSLFSRFPSIWEDWVLFFKEFVYSMRFLKNFNKTLTNYLLEFYMMLISIIFKDVNRINIIEEMTIDFLTFLFEAKNRQASVNKSYISEKIEMIIFKINEEFRHRGMEPIYLPDRRFIVNSFYYKNEHQLTLFEKTDEEPLK